MTITRFRGDTIYNPIFVAHKDNIPRQNYVYRYGETSSEPVRTDIRVIYSPSLVTAYDEILPAAIRLTGQQILQYLDTNGNNNGQYTTDSKAFLIEAVYKAGGTEQFKTGNTGKNSFYIVGTPFVPRSANAGLDPVTKRQNTPKLINLAIDNQTNRFTLRGLAFNSTESRDGQARYRVIFSYPNGVEKIASIKSFSDQRQYSTSTQPEYPEVSQTPWFSMEPASARSGLRENTDLEKNYYYSLSYQNVYTAEKSQVRGLYNPDRWEQILQYYTVEARILQNGIALNYKKKDGKRELNTIYRSKDEYQAINKLYEYV